jgi:protein tyrosine/serine phosphatase
MRPFLDIIHNFHWIAEGEAARSAQPVLALMRRFLARHGIRAVANLRGAHPGWKWWRTESRLLAEAGVAHYNVRLSSRRLPERDLLVALIDIYDAAPRPLLIKCSGGQDRTSLAAALYLVHTRGWGAFDAAAAQFAHFPYLHFPKRHQRWLRLFLDYAREEAAGAPLADWLRESYDRERFAAWLAARGQAGSYRGMPQPRIRK